MSDSYTPNRALIYHIYAVHKWESLTRFLLSGVPHEDIFVHAALDGNPRGLVGRRLTRRLESLPGVRKVLVERNRKDSGEAAGLQTLLDSVPLENYDILTYMHGKGVTKPGNPNVEGWVRMLRYFQIDRHDLCLEAFRNGSALYGVDLARNSPGSNYEPHVVSDFHFSGNFVSVNLTLLSAPHAASRGFFGKLCPLSRCFSAHNSYDHLQNHYLEAYPETMYTDPDQLPVRSVEKALADIPTGWRDHRAFAEWIVRGHSTGGDC